MDKIQKQALQVANHAAIAAVLGEIAKIAGGAVAAGKDEGVEMLRLGLR